MHPFSWNDICVSVGIASVEDVSVTLYKTLPLLVYLIMNAAKVCEVFCKVCNVKRKHEHILSTKFVSNSFLQDTLGLEVHTTEGDMLCLSRYKYFNSFLKSGICTLSSDDVIANL